MYEHFYFLVMVLFIFKYVEYYLKCLFNIRFYFNIITFNDKLKVYEKNERNDPKSDRKHTFFNNIFYF